MFRIPRPREAHQTDVAGGNHPGYPSGQSDQLKTDPRIPLLWPAWDTRVQGATDASYQ